MHYSMQEKVFVQASSGAALNQKLLCNKKNASPTPGAISCKNNTREERRGAESPELEVRGSWGLPRRFFPSSR